MKKANELEVVRGSGNVFRDLGHQNADGEQLKAILAAEIIKKLGFTIDRLMLIVNRLGSRVEVAVKFRQKPGGRPSAAAQ